LDYQYGGRCTRPGVGRNARGGIRHFEGDTEMPQLTKRDGLLGSYILALTVGPDGAIWAATEGGVSRITDFNGIRTIRTFGAVDGLALPVRDVTVDEANTVWLATDGGLFRIIPQGGKMDGVVRDPRRQPVAGVDVLVQGTPFRAVTDAEGHYTLLLPPGPHRLQFTGRLATGGPFHAAFLDVVVRIGEQVLPTVELIPATPRHR
jgi:hypothetical protein